VAYDNTNSGALFKNKDKQQPNHPDYKGNVDVGGVDHWLSAWIKKSKAGETYMSLSVQPKVKVAPKSRSPGEDDEPFDDDIPF
jgi:uncharacterized protein (DUF736 family)